MAALTTQAAYDTWAANMIDRKRSGKVVTGYTMYRFERQVQLHVDYADGSHVMDTVDPGTPIDCYVPGSKNTSSFS